MIRISGSRLTISTLTLSLKTYAYIICHIHERLLSWLGTGTSIKSGVVPLLVVILNYVYTK